MWAKIRNLVSLLIMGYLSGCINHNPAIIDGIRIGDNFSSVRRNPVYASPCDDDKLENTQRRMILYSGISCGETSFSDSKTVIFLLRYSRSNKYRHPIEVIALFGDAHMPASLVADPPLAIKQLPEYGLTWEKYHRDQYLLFNEKDSSPVGTVVGPMPDNIEDPQWQALFQVYTRYTKQYHHTVDTWARRATTGHAQTRCNN